MSPDLHDHDAHGEPNQKRHRSLILDPTLPGHNQPSIVQGTQNGNEILVGHENHF